MNSSNTSERPRSSSRENSSRSSRRPKRAPTKKRLNTFFDETNVIDYKRPNTLSRFLTEHGRIVPRRVSGLSRHDQNRLVQAIERARHLALLPYTITHLNKH